jgi:hypothetical protein
LVRIDDAHLHFHIALLDMLRSRHGHGLCGGLEKYVGGFVEREAYSRSPDGSVSSTESCQTKGSTQLTSLPTMILECEVLMLPISVFATCGIISDR